MLVVLSVLFSQPVRGGGLEDVKASEEENFVNRIVAMNAVDAAAIRGRGRGYDFWLV